jgi:hypothetical protein
MLGRAADASRAHTRADAGSVGPQALRSAGFLGRRDGSVETSRYRVAMAGERKIGQPLDVKTQERAAELIGLGLSHREAAGACAISEKSVERILRKPEYKKVADEVRKRRTSVTASMAAVVHDLLDAEDSNGEPNMMLRKMGAELVMKNPALLESVEDMDGEDTLLPGVVLRFPWGGAPQEGDGDAAEVEREGTAVVSDSLSFGSEGRAEDGCPPGAEIENGLALAPPIADALDLAEAFEPLLEDAPLFKETDYR